MVVYFSLFFGVTKKKYGFYRFTIKAKWVVNIMFTILKDGFHMGKLEGNHVCPHYVSEFDDPGSNAAEAILKPMPIRTASNGLVDS